MNYSLRRFLIFRILRQESLQFNEQGREVGGDDLPGFW
jgi:hypothetical protein